MTPDLPTPAAAPADDGEFRQAIEVAAYQQIRSMGQAAHKAFRIGEDLMSLIHARDARRDAALRAIIAEISAKLVEAGKRAQAAEARCAELEAALRPFAETLTQFGDDEPDDHYIWCKDRQGAFLESYRLGDLRRARAALPADGAAQEGRG